MTGHSDADSDTLREMFDSAQWAHASDAAAALGQMAARSAKGDSALAILVREQQDLGAEWQSKDKLLTSSHSLPPDRRKPETETALSARLAAIDGRLVEINSILKKDYRDYAALVSLESLSPKDVQTQLHDDEALVLELDTPEARSAPEETFIWIVTKSDMRWVISGLGTKALKDSVTTLRCGLDRDGEWKLDPDKNRWLARDPVCKMRWPDGLASDEELPFDTAKAYELYKALLGGAEDLIAGRQLLIIASGPLTQLPFQVLVTEASDPALSGIDAWRRAAWLIRSHALTMLPSVSSLEALRVLDKSSKANRPLFGIGNPLLDGPSADYQGWAGAARSKQSCPKQAVRQVATLEHEKRGVLPFTLRGGLADVEEIRSQVPLPETADELCAVARDMGAGDDDIRLGARATETAIKRLSETGELAKYRVIHFATHGALAGQVSGDSEPGLLLTPPDKATEIDDGYLSAPDIAGLKLDADWVILSACNTAAGGAEGAEALSGLARAFFYAGARALLVSHWSVELGGHGEADNGCDRQNVGGQERRAG